MSATVTHAKPHQPRRRTTDDLARFMAQTLAAPSTSEAEAEAVGASRYRRRRTGRGTTNQNPTPPVQTARELLMDSTTRPRTAYRDILIGIRTGVDDQDEPDVQNVLYALLDDLHEAPAFDVALGAFEIINWLTAELSVWTGQSAAETLRELAATIAPKAIP